MAPLPPRSQDLVHILPQRTFLSSITDSLAHRSIPNLVRRGFSDSLSNQLIKKRQTIVAIPTTYGSLNSGPSPGTIVGIVLGSVFGFLFILWLLYTVFAFGGGGRRNGVSSITTEVVRERRGKSRATRSRSRRRVSETVERVETRRVSPRRPPPPPAPAPMERVIVEETREETREERILSRPPPVRRMSEDEVVVIEEHSPPRRKSSRRERSRETAGAYRTVDPLAYGGGGAPMREVSRKASSRRSRG